MTSVDPVGASHVLAFAHQLDKRIGARTRQKLRELIPTLTQGEFAARLEMTPLALSRALEGTRPFTSGELTLAAGILGTSVHWLSTGDPDPFAVKVAGRQTFDHSLKSHTPVDWSGLDETITHLARAYAEVYPVPVGQSGLPPVPPSAAEARAELIRCAPVEFVSQFSQATELAFDVDVVRIGESRDGIAIEVGGHFAIIVGETGNWFFQNWTIAHELGHIAHGDLSERGTAAGDNPAAERAANAFAAELLMPEAILRAIPWQRATEHQIADFVWTSGVSTNALLTRLTSLGIDLSGRLRVTLESSTQALLRRSGIVSGGDTDRVTQRMDAAAARRFPQHLISAHAEAVASGRLDRAMLSWMLGTPD